VIVKADDKADDEAVSIYDPLHGQCRISRQSLTNGWTARRNPVILVDAESRR
jgi:hypothetical protein